MSVIVRGMEMPESCEECCMLTDAGFCSAKPKDFCGYASDFFLIRPDWCPLAEIPEKHGDLRGERMTKTDIIQIIETIIEREKVDSCNGCVYWEKQEWELPCSKCKRNCTDYWRRAEVTE